VEEPRLTACRERWWERRLEMPGKKVGRAYSGALRPEAGDRVFLTVAGVPGRVSAVLADGLALEVIGVTMLDRIIDGLEFTEAVGDVRFLRRGADPFGAGGRGL